MKHRDKFYLAILAAFATLSAWGITKMTSVQMVNSTVDSTPIGQTTPAAGSFTSVIASYARVNGDGTHPFIWFGSEATSGFSPGGNIGLWLDSLGYLRANTVIAAPTFSGNLAGNALTASALAAAPGNCSTGSYTTGIAADGTAQNCTAIPAFTGTSGYQIEPSGLIFEWVSTGALGNNTPTTVSIPHALTHALFAVTCSDNGGRVQSGNVQAVGANTSGLSAPFNYFYASTPATGVSAYCTVIGY